ncbi:MAG: class I tRNA ligase family protein, partial [Patescibacteria group bacterium]
KYKILNTKYCKTLVLLLAPLAPHITEELFQRIKNQESRIKNKKKTKHNSQFIIHDSIHVQPWPKYDDKFLKEDRVTIAVQVNGKIRGTIRAENSRPKADQPLAEKIKNQKDVERLARESANVQKHLEGKKIKKVIYVEGRIINFVVNS